MGKHSKRTSIRLITLIISFVQGICTAKTAASELSETELRAVISTWRSVRQVIEKGAQPNDSTPGYRLAWGPSKPMSRTEKQMAVEISREAERWRDFWFITISDNEFVSVYFVPDEVRNRLRRGKVLTFALLDWRVRAMFPNEKLPQMFVDDYVQIGDEPLRAFDLGENNRPFKVSGGLSLDEVSEIVELIRAPKKPLKAGAAFDFQQMQIDARDRSEPIISMRRDADIVNVTTGHIRGMWAGSGDMIECKRVKGWVITRIWFWNS